MAQTKLCELHNIWMTEKIGKNGKPYFGHKVEGQYGMCFGNPSNAARIEPPISTNLDQSRPTQLQEETKTDWDAKDRQSIAQTALNNAANIFVALTTAQAIPYNSTEDLQKAIKKMANQFFNDILELKNQTNVGD